KVQLLSTCVTLILRKSPPTPVLANTRRLDASPSTRSPRGTFSAQPRQVLAWTAPQSCSSQT
ncbi:MAG: hypothetical protein WB679_13970, partial [Terracidiphilus sp.]